MVTAMRGDRARTAIKGTRFTELRWVDETGSTNRDLAEFARDGGQAGVVLVADYQSAGRGRLDRDWVSPPGESLLVSVLLRPVLVADESALLTAAMAVSAAEACSLVAPLNPGIKWPNDLVVVAGDRYHGRKLGGVLAEGVVEDGRVSTVAVGLGLNVNWSGESAPELAEVAVGLNQVLGHEVDREAILVELLRRLDEWLDQVTTPAGRQRLLDRYRQLSATIGRRVRVTLPDGVIEGVASDITEQGVLLVEVAGEDHPREVIAGDIVHLRNA